VVRILSVRPTDRKVRHSNSKIVSESEHLISITIRTALVSGNSKLDFYDPNMMNITIRHKIYCLYPYSIREFCPRKKNYLYPQYPFASDPFSSLVVAKLPVLALTAVVGARLPAAVAGGGGRPRRRWLGAELPCARDGGRGKVACGGSGRGRSYPAVAAGARSPASVPTLATRWSSPTPTTKTSPPQFRGQ
jgi:hypothetical protein